MATPRSSRSFSPFDIKGKGQTKIFSSFVVHTPPECLLKFLNELPLTIDHICKRKNLQGTQNYGLWYPRYTDLTLHAYTDADWARSVDDRKSTSGGAFFMRSRLVSWFSKKQSSIALSTAEAEYVAVASCYTQLLWMMQTLQDFQITCTPPISILCDNTSAISISKNLVMHSKTKHIPIKYHFLREQVLEQKVKLEYFPSKEQVTDILTKPLPRETFEYLKQKLGVVDVSSCC